AARPHRGRRPPLLHACAGITDNKRRKQMHLVIRPTVLRFRTGALIAIAALVAACGGASVTPPSATTAPGGSTAAASDPALAELRIDYATYSPPSLVLKKQGS